MDITLMATETGLSVAETPPPLSARGSGVKRPLPNKHPPHPTLSSTNGAAAPMEVRIYRSGVWTVVQLAGEVDIQGVPSVRSVLNGHGPYIVFDLRRVTFMDCSGLGLLAGALGSERPTYGQVRVAGASRQVRKLMVLALLDGPLTMYESLEDALTAPTTRVPETNP